MKQNPNYEASAVKLNNPPEVINGLAGIHTLQAQIAELTARIQQSIPAELTDDLTILHKMLAEATESIKKDIDELGGYQDTALGHYALKQRRESITYKPELVNQFAPAKVAEFVLIQAVDSKALEALAKAGQISPEELKKCGETKESFSYIIR